MIKLMMSQMYMSKDYYSQPYFTSVLSFLPPFLRVTATASTPSSGSLRYGDLELFLMGLHLGHLVPLFQVCIQLFMYLFLHFFLLPFKSHQIKFSDLLSMTDHDLESVGVTQVGVRKTILDSITNIHKSAWKMPPNQQLYNRTLRLALDSVAGVCVCVCACMHALCVCAHVCLDVSVNQGASAVDRINLDSLCSAGPH